MAKYAPAAIKATWPHVDRAFKSVKFGGILEGSAAGNGYHHSRSDLIRRGKTGAYSIQHKLDKQGDPDAASAIDYVFDDVDELALVTRRLLRAAQKKDPRLFGKLREFGGTLDGERVTAYNVTEQRFISMDKTHLWHAHLSGHRAFADDEKVWLGIAEVVLGLAAGALTGGSSGGGGGGGGTKPEPKPYKPSQRAIYVDILKDAPRRKPKNSDSVYWWQRIMNAISFPNGKEIKVTGSWTDETTAETKKAQKSIKDTQDGWPGPKQIEYFAEKAKGEVGSISIYRSSKTGGLIHKT